MDTEEIQQEVVNARNEINDIKAKVGVLFTFVLVCIIFTSVIISFH